MEQHRRHIHGRRWGRRLRPLRQALLSEVLPHRQLALPEDSVGRIDITELFSVSTSELWLEIGFGAGEHLAYQARSHPGTGLIGCEIFASGISRFLAHVEGEEVLDRIRIVVDDGIRLIESLPDDCVNRLFILFPDPWPKKRHHKRRLINSKSIDLFARVLCDGAEIRLASDDSAYVRWILWHFMSNETFEWCAERAKDWRVRPDDWPATRYERKALVAGRRPIFLRYVRTPRSKFTEHRQKGETP